MRTMNKIQVSEEEMYKLQVHKSHRAQVLQAWQTPAQGKTKGAEEEKEKAHAAEADSSTGETASSSHNTAAIFQQQTGRTFNNLDYFMVE